MHYRFLHIKTILLLAVLFCFLPGLKAQSDYKIREVKIEGNSALNRLQLKESMNTKSKTLTNRLMFWKKFPRFSSYTLNDDIERLKKLYQRNGVLFPEIDYVLDRDEKSKSVKILVKIKESRPVTVNRIAVAPTPDEKVNRILDGSSKKLGIKTGDRFVDDKVIASETALRNSLADNGYPFAKVTKAVSLLPEKDKADISFSAEAGPFTYFGETIVRGDSLVPESFIRNQLKYKENELFSKEMMEKSQRQLYDTELFQYVVVRSLQDSLKDDRLPILVQMKEKPRWTLEAGVGYGSEDKFRFSLDATRRQFFGGARKLVFKGKHSYYLPISLEAQFIQPDFLRDKLDLILNPFFIKENEISYEVQRTGGGITFQRTFKPDFTGYVMYSMEVDEFSYKDVETIDPNEELPYNKAGITTGINYSKTNDIFSPTKGKKINSYFTWMGPGFNSAYHYLKFEVSARKYWDLSNDWSLAGKLGTGVIHPIQGDTITPVEDRFMLGGAMSMRGWGRNEISPQNSDGAYVGGNTMVETSLEMRFPLYDILSGVGFVEAGNVWEDSFYYDLTDLRYDIGIGLRVKTPIGPIRVDYATPVFEGAFDGVLFISIGQAF
jgi:outer membrane protein insertion porin family